MDEKKDLMEKIESLISSIKMELILIVKKFKDNRNDMDIKLYIWTLYAGNIVYKTEDLISIIKTHKNSEHNKIKSSLYILERSILEDVMYLRYFYAESEKGNLQKIFDAYKVYNYKKNLLILESLDKLNERGKYHYHKDDSGLEVLTKKGSVKKIDELKSEIKFLENNYLNDKSFSDAVNRINKVERICIEYDSLKNINSVKEGSELKSLEYVYNFLYRFKSLYTHQSINAKENVLDVLFYGKSDNDYTELLSLLFDILTTTKQTKDDMLGIKYQDLKPYL